MCDTKDISTPDGVLPSGRVAQRQTIRHGVARDVVADQHKPCQLRREERMAS